jgi:hypothetical protein
MKTSRTQPLPPIRVRHEPPTIEEALAAAEDLTSIPQQQAEIAAGLMGMTVEEIRPRLRASQAAGPSRRLATDRASAPGSRGVLVVERKVRRVTRAQPLR